MKTINFSAAGQEWEIPNCWELLSPMQFEQLITDAGRLSRGEISLALLKVNYICNVMSWDASKIDEEGYQNLAWLAEQVTFIFRIVYPDNDAALSDLKPGLRAQYKILPPERIKGALSRYLATLDYRYVLNACFCAQLVPMVTIEKTHYSGYAIDTSFSNLTCSLTALQYIEARRLLGCEDEMLPLLAAILYHPQPYNSESAHRLAAKFKALLVEKLRAIEFNFRCFNNYLFTCTDFAILTAAREKKESRVTTGALESLYNLSSDGMGDVNTVEQMNLIKYLTIIRKKLIESVRSFADLKLERTDIAEKTGLPLPLINDILL